MSEAGGIRRLPPLEWLAGEGFRLGAAMLPTLAASGVAVPGQQPGIGFQQTEGWIRVESSGWVRIVQLSPDGASIRSDVTMNPSRIAEVRWAIESPGAVS